MGRFLFSLFILVCSSVNLYAGDIANFVNLGFSGDSRYFMFAQYGVNENRIYSELYTVDVKKNSFIDGGVVKKYFEQNVSSLEDGTGALYNTVAGISAFAEKTDIDFLRKGRCLYLNINGDDGKNIDFRDFKTKKSYKIVLSQSVKGEKESLKSSFSIDFEIGDESGKILNYKAGNPLISRNGVSDYRIRKVILAPDEKGLIFVIEKNVSDKDSVSVRYMIESFRF